MAPGKSPIGRLEAVRAELRSRHDDVDVAAMRRESKRDWESIPRTVDADD